MITVATSYFIASAKYNALINYILHIVYFCRSLLMNLGQYQCKHVTSFDRLSLYSSICKGPERAIYRFETLSLNDLPDVQLFKLAGRVQRNMPVPGQKFIISRWVFHVNHLTPEDSSALATSNHPAATFLLDIHNTTY